MSFPKRAATLLAALLLLAGCGDPPSPFVHQTPFGNPLLRPGLRAGVVVAPVATPAHDVPGDVITDAVVLALRDADIPALTGAEAVAGTAQAPKPVGPPPPGPAKSVNVVPRPTLHGEILQPDATGPMRLNWRLVAPDGHEITHFVSEPRVAAADWQTVSPQLRSAIADDVVRGIDRYLDDAEGLPPEMKALPKVTIAGVDGVPGAGPQAMSRALEYHLKQAGLTVGDNLADDGAIIMGAISVKPAAARGGQPQDNLRVAWTVLRADGRELGVISQANDVPHASLQGAWGDLAFLIAEAAAPGIIDLLQQAVQADAEAAAAKSGALVTPPAAPASATPATPPAQAPAATPAKPQAKAPAKSGARTAAKKPATKPVPPP
ncbi:MAG TPA: hypothetical protein VGO34_05835 [Alphaproteobacteria bacterium]